MDAATGRIIWEQSVSEIIGSPSDAFIVDSMASDPQLKILYFAASTDTGVYSTGVSNALVAVSGNSGELLWMQRVNGGEILSPQESANAVGFGMGPQLFCIEEGNDFIGAVGIGGLDGYYYAFNRESGEMIWSSKVYDSLGGQGAIFGDASIVNGRIEFFVNARIEGASPAAGVALNQNTGELLWETAFQSPSGDFAGAASRCAYFAADDSGNIYALNSETGMIENTLSLPGAPVCSDFVIDEDLLYFGSETELLALQG